MRLLASISISHWPSGITLHTILEETESETDARMHFSKLADIISLLEKDVHSIVLETTNGYVSLTRKYLADCVLTLNLTSEEDTK